MLAAFLGAGFSKWAAELPVASELFDFSIRPISIREERLLRLIKEDKQNWDETNRNGYAEAFISWALDQTKNKRKRLVWYVTRRLSEPFLAPIRGGMQTFMIDQRGAREHPGVIKAQRLLRCFVGWDASGIVTSNYDLLIEYALTTDHFNYGIKGAMLKGRNKNPLFFSQGGPVYLKGDTPLAKIHGSVSWDIDHRYTDGRCGLKGNALIIPPKPEKIASIELADQWSLAAAIISKATKLLVFGFAFNEYDQALLRLLSDSGKNIQQVLLVDICPNIKAAQRVWPTAKIIATGPPKPPEFAWDRWFDQ